MHAGEESSHPFLEGPPMVVALSQGRSISVAYDESSMHRFRFSQLLEVSLRVSTQIDASSFTAPFLALLGPKLEGDEGLGIPIINFHLNPGRVPQFDGPQDDYVGPMSLSLSAPVVLVNQRDVLSAPVLHCHRRLPCSEFRQKEITVAPLNIQLRKESDGVLAEFVLQTVQRGISRTDNPSLRSP